MHRLKGSVSALLLPLLVVSMVLSSPVFADAGAEKIIRILDKENITESDISNVKRLIK